MAATSAAASGRVDIARRVLPSAIRPRSMPRRRSWPAIITPQPNGVSSEKASGRRKSSVRAESVTWGIIALTSGGSRSAIAH